MLGWMRVTIQINEYYEQCDADTASPDSDDTFANMQWSVLESHSGLCLRL